MMKETWKIATWEIMRNLRNKQFLIGLLLTPALIALFAVLPALLDRWNQPAPSEYYVVDKIDAFHFFAESPSPSVSFLEYTDDLANINEDVQENKLAGYFILDEEFLETGEIEVVLNNRMSEGENIIRTLLSSVLQYYRIQQTNIDTNTLVYVTAPAIVHTVSIDQDDDAFLYKIVVAVAYMILIFYLVFASGSMLMYSALQERRDRMAEVVLSSIGAQQLMQGKIIGHFILGIIQLAFWLLLGIPALIYFVDFPVWEAITQSNVVVPIFYALLGYLLFSALFVGMGATMEDIQSAGNSQGLVIMIPMMGLFFIGPVISNPDGLISQLASIFPLTSPIIMVLRAAITDVGLWEFILSGILLILATILIVKASAKIFRIGMLMYGKNADLREIIRWLRYKDV
jgi:ABC-2 type transport system permease protein